MRPQIRLVLIAFALAFAVGLVAGCVSDFEFTEEGPYECETDQDCVAPGHVCDNEPAEARNDNRQPTMTCMNNSAIPSDSTNGNDLDECDTDHEDYPFDEPLEIQEVCDGEDNNCDGNVDIIFCGEGTMGCPGGSDLEDPNGCAIQYRCNEDDYDPPRCEAQSVDTFGDDPSAVDCTVVLECVGGQIEAMPPECCVE